MIWHMLNSPESCVFSAISLFLWQSLPAQEDKTESLFFPRICVCGKGWTLKILVIKWGQPLINEMPMPSGKHNMGCQLLAGRKFQIHFYTLCYLTVHVEWARVFFVFLPVWKSLGWHQEGRCIRQIIPWIPDALTHSALAWVGKNWGIFRTVSTPYLQLAAPFVGDAVRNRSETFRLFLPHCGAGFG